MAKDWLWDRKISDSKIKSILKKPDNPRFMEFAGLLLSRKNTPKEVFKSYLDKLVFCKNWYGIKREMRKDKWNNPRIEFWQEVYDVLAKKYKKTGTILKEAKKYAINPLCKTIGLQIRERRKSKELNQSELAKKMRVSQQVVSRIEKGIENISIATLKKVTDALGVGVDIVLK